MNAPAFRVLGLICLACAGHSRRVQTARESIASLLHDDYHIPSEDTKSSTSPAGVANLQPNWQHHGDDPLSALTELLTALNPSDAWRSVGNPGASTASRHAGRPLAVLMNSKLGGSLDVNPANSTDAVLERQMVDKIKDAMRSHNSSYDSGILRGGKTVQEDIKQEFPLLVNDLEQVVSTMKDDIPQMLHKEPDWDIFSERFTVINQRSEQLVGLRSSQLLFKFLRWMGTKFIIEEETKVVTEESIFFKKKKAIRFKWNVRVIGFRPISLWRRRLVFEFDTVFELNEKNEIDKMQIENCLANGQHLVYWPKARLPTAEIEVLEAKRKALLQEAKELTEQVDLLQDKLKEAIADRQDAKDTYTEEVDTAKRGLEKATGALRNLEPFDEQSADTSSTVSSSFDSVIELLTNTASNFSEHIAFLERKEREAATAFQAQETKVKASIASKSNSRASVERDLKVVIESLAEKIEGVQSEENLDIVLRWAEKLRVALANAAKKERELQARQQKEKEQAARLENEKRLAQEAKAKAEAKARAAREKAEAAKREEERKAEAERAEKERQAAEVRKKKAQALAAKAGEEARAAAEAKAAEDAKIVAEAVAAEKAKAEEKAKAAQERSQENMARNIDALKADISSILRKEPRWGLFTDDFQVYDRRNFRKALGLFDTPTLSGLRKTMVLLKKLRWIAERFAVKEDIQFDFIDGETYMEEIVPKRSFKVRWRIEVRGEGATGFVIEPIDFDLRTVFHLTDTNRIDFVRIDKFTANGQVVRDWPQLIDTDDFDEDKKFKDEANMKKMRAWTAVFREEKAKMEKVQQERQAAEAEVKKTEERNAAITKKEEERRTAEAIAEAGRRAAEAAQMAKEIELGLREAKKQAEEEEKAEEEDEELEEDEEEYDDDDEDDDEEEEDEQEAAGALPAKNFMREPTEGALYSLKADISKIMRREPNWEAFDKNVQVVYQTGDRLSGRLRGQVSAMAWFRLLRLVATRFDAKENIEADMNFADLTRPLFPKRCFVVRCDISLAGVRQFGIWPKPVDISTEAFVQLNDKKQVALIRFSKWIVNGQEVQSLPDVKLSEDDATNLQKIEDWAQAVEQAT